MKLKAVSKYSVDFHSKWVSVAGFFTGLSFFLLAVKYFGVENLSTRDFGEILVSMILPMLILCIFGVSLCGFKFRAAPLYGIICSLYSVFLVIRAFSGTGGSVLGAVWYVLIALLALATTFGFLPSRIFMLLGCLLPVIYRLCFVDPVLYFQSKDWLGFLTEAAALSGLAAFSAFTLCIKRKQKH